MSASDLLRALPELGKLQYFKFSFPNVCGSTDNELTRQSSQYFQINLKNIFKIRNFFITQQAVYAIWESFDIPANAI